VLEQDPKNSIGQQVRGGKSPPSQPSGKVTIKAIEILGQGTRRELSEGEIRGENAEMFQ